MVILVLTLYQYKKLLNLKEDNREKEDSSDVKVVNLGRSKLIENENAY